MPLYKLKRAYFDGMVLHQEGKVLPFAKDKPIPRGAEKVTAREATALGNMSDEESALAQDNYEKELTESVRQKVLAELQEGALEEVASLNKTALPASAPTATPAKVARK